MSVEPATPQPIFGELCRAADAFPVQVVHPARHTLVIRFLNGRIPESGETFSGLKLRVEGREVPLGPCQYEEHKFSTLRRQDDPKPLGHGRLVFTDNLYDFANLSRSGIPIDLRTKLQQLPVLWGRKDSVQPQFREFTAKMVYDLQVYRAFFDEVDRNLADEPKEVRERVHRVVTDREYGAFCKLFDGKLAELEELVKGFKKEEHERHGFYFRKHVWDIILASDFLTRTNLKPRGYAGDSAMMRMVYEEAFQGPTIFSKFVHHHPLQSAAAQAVRNRRGVVRERLQRAAANRVTGAPRVRVMSVACGPAWELRDLLQSPADFERYQLTLLDQDVEALAEARDTVFELEQKHGAMVPTELVRDSVRTMLRTRDLSERWGRFEFLYSMGLFDYLTTPVARAVLAKLYDLLTPGGELVIGNFHVRNPTRVYMEYWMDWVLVYRTEDELLDLAWGLPGADASLVFEETGSQMFLCIRKGG
jgi:extracellular factor (EF) 3-hydroxypalmitic acid methyl ester biosynthesis protein